MILKIMMNMKKQLLLVLLALMPLMISAEEVEIDGIYYNLVSKIKEAEVISNPNEYRGNIVIPEEVEYEDVVYKVTSIGNSAFSDCLSLYSIDTGNGVKTIGQRAFYKCKNLQTLKVGRNIVSFGYQSLYLCQRLANIYITDLAAWCNVSGISIGCEHHLYLNGNEIIDLSIPDGVTSIGESAFAMCSYIQSINFTNSIAVIGSTCFYGCSGISTIEIPNSVTTIGESAFGGCISLTSITIPNSVTSIGEFTFRDCSGLTSITIPNSVTSIGQYAFWNCIGLTSVSIPNSVSYIEASAFEGCSGLTSVAIGKGIRRIGIQTFANCQNLTDVYCYAETVPSTYSNAFDGSYIDYATLYVPEVTYESYKNTAPWSNFGTIKVIDGETPIVEKCATPTITYANGKVKFTSETEGVEFVPSITVTPNQLQNGNELAIGGTFTVSVYAVKEGYDNSDTATMTINMSQIGDVNADGELNAADITAVVNAILGK